MKGFFTVVLCLLTGTLTALLASFVPKLFTDFMEIANTGASWGVYGWLVFFYIGLFATALFFAGHAFRILNKKVVKLVEGYFKFLD